MCRIVRVTKLSESKLQLATTAFVVEVICYSS